MEREKEGGREREREGEREMRATLQAIKRSTLFNLYFIEKRNY